MRSWRHNGTRDLLFIMVQPNHESVESVESVESLAGCTKPAAEGLLDISPASAQDGVMGETPVRWD